MQRMNGWQRLWFVLSIFGLLYAVWCAFIYGTEEYPIDHNHKVLLAFDKPECKMVIAMPAGHKLDPEPSLDSPCWDLYLYRSNYEDARSNQLAYIEHNNSLKLRAALEAFRVAFILWLVYISLLYLAGKIVAWVLRGFFPKP